MNVNTGGREAFEAHMRALGWTALSRVADIGQYHSEPVEDRWRLWLASRAVAFAEQAGQAANDSRVETNAGPEAA